MMSNVPGIIFIYCKNSSIKGILAAIQNMTFDVLRPFDMNKVCDNKRAKYHNISGKQNIMKYIKQFPSYLTSSEIASKNPESIHDKAYIGSLNNTYITSPARSDKIIINILSHCLNSS